MKKIKEIVLKAYMFFCNKIFGVDVKKVVFVSFSGKSYSCNPKAISEKLHELNSDIKIVWLFNNPEEKSKSVPEYIKCVKNRSMKSFKELATSKVWVSNFGMSTGSYKSNKQKYIQTWHGDRGFKKVLYDYWTLLPNGCYKEGSLFETENADLMTVGSSFGIKKIRGAFAYNRDLIKSGSPRNDMLIQGDDLKKNAIKKSINLSINSKIVLFAPTFRTDSKGKEQKIKELNFKEFIEELNLKNASKKEDWFLLVRGHSVSGGLRIGDECKYVIDVTNYDDMAELLLIADVFITDYSSSAGDFILRKKPMVLFQPDSEKYTSKERSLYFDIKDSPFIVAKNQEELMNKIVVMTEKDAVKNCEDIMDFYGVFETGEASKKVAEYIMDQCK